MDRTILFKANADSPSFPNLRVRNQFTNETIVQYIKDCSKQIDKHNIEINVQELENRFFPTPHRMIFISHLSTDSTEAHDIKTILEAKCPNFSCFIDSDIWGNMYKIRERLQIDYALNERGLYWHELSNNICQHLTLILSMALMKAIRNSPYFLYLPHGKEGTAEYNRLLTQSPWVCQELLTASLLSEPKSLITETANFSKNASMNLRFQYEACTKHLHAASLADFINYVNKH